MYGVPVAADGALPSEVLTLCTLGQECIRKLVDRYFNEEGYAVGDDILGYLSGYQVPNIRDLQHSVSRVVAHAKQEAKEITLEYVKALLSSWNHFPELFRWC